MQKCKSEEERRTESAEARKEKPSEFVSSELKGLKFLLTRAEVGRDILPEKIKELGESLMSSLHTGL